MRRKDDSGWLQGKEKGVLEVGRFYTKIAKVIIFINLINTNRGISIKPRWGLYLCIHPFTALLNPIL